MNAAPSRVDGGLRIYFFLLPAGCSSICCVERWLPRTWLRKRSRCRAGSFRAWLAGCGC
jgi:hypothetical protein